MRKRDKDRLTELVDAASGTGSVEFVRPEDMARLTQFQSVVACLRSGFFDAPPESIARAKSIVPRPVRRRLDLRMLSTMPGLAGVRLEAGDESQVLFDAEGTKIRVMYGRTASGYSVIGRVEAEGWTATCGDQEIDCGPDGRFEFQVESLEQTGIVLRSPNDEVVIPPIEETPKSAGDLDRPR